MASFIDDNFSQINHETACVTFSSGQADPNYSNMDS